MFMYERITKYIRSEEKATSNREVLTANQNNKGELESVSSITYSITTNGKDDKNARRFREVVPEPRKQDTLIENLIVQIECLSKRI